MGGMALCGCLRKVDKPFEKHPKKKEVPAVYSLKKL
jgi:hypothetical protein